MTTAQEDDLSTNDKPTRRLARIEVIGLFHSLHHVVSLRQHERITIIHGPNGVGKTILMRMVSSFFAGDYLAFRTIPFKELALTFTDNSSVRLSRTSTRLQNGQLLDVKLAFSIAVGDSHFSITHTLNESHLSYAKKILSALPNLVPAGSNEWTNFQEGKVFTTVEAWRHFEDDLPEEARAKGMFDDPPELQSVRDGTRVRFIETQRLIAPHIDNASLRATVSECSADLRRQIHHSERAYGREAERLDSSFPRRLLEGSAAISLNEIRAQMAELAEQRTRLRALGLVQRPIEKDGVELDKLDSLSDSQREVMTLYLADMAHKTSVVSELHKRIELLLALINSKFKNKTLSTSRLGLGLRDAHNDRVSLDALSSGEQHELVMFYELLFNIEEGSLVLIDEPELSLHVEWQKTYLLDLINVMKRTKCDVIVATHSPFIIDDRIDLMEALGGGN